jgi:hypothetical protein
MPPVGEAIDEMPHNHVAPPTRVTYNHNPPTSGCHYNLGYGNAPLQAGAYNQVIQPEYWVHNLEHGYIIVVYNCPSGCDAQFQQLRSWYRSLPADPSGAVAYAKVLILPWPSLQAPFAAVSWDWYSDSGLQHRRGPAFLRQPRRPGGRAQCSLTSSWACSLLVREPKHLP